MFAGHATLYFAFGFFFLDGLAFVNMGFTGGEGELDFGDAAGVEKEDEGDEGAGGALGLGEEVGDLAAAGEELARGFGLVLSVGGGVGVGPHVHLVEPELHGGRFDTSEGLGEGALAGADGLDLGALEHDAALELFEDVVLVPGAAVFDTSLLLFFFLRGFGHGRKQCSLLVREKAGEEVRVEPQAAGGERRGCSWFSAGSSAAKTQAGGGLFADAEGGENFSDDVVGGELATEGGEVVEGATEGVGDEFDVVE